MRTVIVGGGPAGLCAALLLKQQNPGGRVTVIERHREGETYGWGITLPRRTADLLASSDRALAAGLVERSVAWNEVRLIHRGLGVRISGTPLLGIARATLLELFVGRCREAGVELRFGTRVEPPFEPDCDLLVIAEGAHGILRRQHAADFGTVSEEYPTYFVWLGTPRLFPSLSLGFEQTPEGLLTAHCYPFSASASTFIVECRGDTLQRAGLAGRTSADTCTWLAAAFADLLQGERLLFHHMVAWRRFMRVKSARWRRGRTVLVGDAAHALHFSVGSGTLLAIEDAVALAASLGECQSIDAALDCFESGRQDALHAYFQMERRMLDKLERAAELVRLEPLQLAYAFLA